MVVILFVVACGFVTAGLLNAIHLSLQGQVEEATGNGLVLYFHSPIAIAWSMFICVFAGPYLIVSQGLRFWMDEHLPFGALAFCGVISIVWSFCSGVFMTEIFIQASNLVG